MFLISYFLLFNIILFINFSQTFQFFITLFNQFLFSFYINLL